MPLTYQDFRFEAARAVAFTPGGQVSIPRLLVTLLGRWADLFDGEPATLPGGQEMPPEIPRILLQSANQEFRLQISGRSAVFGWERQDQNLDYDIKKFVTLAHEVLTFYLDAAPARAGRVLLNTQRLAPDPDPSGVLIRHFCQPRWQEGVLNREENFELHAHKIFQMRPEFRVNSLVKCKSVRLATEEEEESPEPHPYVSVEQEISSLSEVAGEVQFSPEEMQTFLQVASEEADHIVELYFPKD